MEKNVKKKLIKFALALGGVVMVLASIMGAMAAPTTPSITCPREHAYGEQLNPFIHGSSGEGKPLTYYCKFTNIDEELLIKEFSTDCTIKPTEADLGDKILVEARAFDGDEWSRTVSASVKVVEFINTVQPEEELNCPAGQVRAYTTRGTPYCDDEQAAVIPQDAEGAEYYKEKLLIVGGVLWPSMPWGGVAVIVLLVAGIVNLIVDVREKRKIKARLEAVYGKEERDDGWR